MAQTVVTALLVLAGLYLVAGAVFAVPFVARWVDRIDPGAAKSTRGFRVVIFPGVVAFWPLFAMRLLRGMDHPPVERNAHRLATAAAIAREEDP